MAWRTCRPRRSKTGGVLAAVAAAGALAAASPATAADPVTGHACGTGEQATVTFEGATFTVTSVQARKPGSSDWEDARPGLCVILVGSEESAATDPDPATSDRYMSVNLLRNNGGVPDGPDLAPEYPAGTRFSIAATTTVTPMIAVGRANRVRAALTPSTVVLQADAITMRSPTIVLNPDNTGYYECDGGTTHASTLYATIVLDPIGDGPVAQWTRAARGTILATGGWFFVPPTGTEADGNKLLEFGATGCEDGNPATDDIFIRGFLPTSAVESMGLDSDVLAAAPDTALDHLMLMTSNNGLASELASPATADDVATEDDGVVSAGTGGTERVGVLIDGRPRTPSHLVHVGVRASAASAAAACLARGGEIRTSDDGLGCTVAEPGDPRDTEPGGDSGSGGAPTAVQPEQPESVSPAAPPTTDTPTAAEPVPLPPTDERRDSAPRGRTVATIGDVQLIAGTRTPRGDRQAASQGVTLGRDGRMAVSLGTLYAPRGARVVARVRVPIAGRKRDRRRSVLSTTRIALAAGESRPLTVRLNRSVARRVPRGRAIRVRVQLAVTTPEGTTVRTTRTLRVAVRSTATARRA